MLNNAVQWANRRNDVAISKSKVSDQGHARSTVPSICSALAGPLSFSQRQTDNEKCRRLMVTAKQHVRLDGTQE